MPRLGVGLKNLWRRRVPLHVLSAASVVWLVVMLLPLILISFYAYPTYDDFPLSLPTAVAWARTGSLWATVKAAWEYVGEIYHTWQGTFAAMFISGFQPLVFSSRLFFLSPLLTLAGLCFSAGYFCHRLIRGALGADRSVCIIVYAWLMTMVLQFLPSAREVLFWHSGTPYVWSVTAIFLMLGLLLRLCRPASTWKYALYSLCLFLCGVVLGGCPYPLALGGTVGFAIICAWRFARRGPERWGSLAAFLGAVAALAVSCAAPGIEIRMEVSSVQEGGAMGLGPVSAVVQSIFRCLVTTGQWLPLQLAASAVLLVPLLLPLLQRAKARFEHPFWFSFLSFGVLASSFVPPIFVMGLEGYVVERVLSSLYLLYVILFTLNVVYWLGFLVGRGMFAEEGFFSRWGKGVTVGRLALCAALLAWGVCSNAVSTTLGPSAAAAKSLLTGEAAYYHQEMLEREEGIATGENAEAVDAYVHSLRSVPTVFARDRLPTNTGGGRKLIPMMRRYLRMHWLAETYGAGRIPEAEWEALEAWLTQ